MIFSRPPDGAQIFALVFLGNPGRQYEQTRHNAGRLLVPYLNYFFTWQKKFKGNFAKITRLDGSINKTLCFLEPETYMNLSGESVAGLVCYYKIPYENILVVHDELELELGQISLKFGGGLGGHKGLRSIKASLNSADFWRLRIGIGRPPGEKNKTSVSDWVLSCFSMEESVKLKLVLEHCAAAVEKFVTEGPQTLLPEWNKINILAA
ncbi:MAG: aminoacyl-tRNA hydrolase [Spirochaetaceae bacterium]|jgi:PTH1 family peptidyl-tRNA hydrolase|nr:aminoacyl-tRNA hydrolase [Spirochaetaceae bacterium]